MDAMAADPDASQVDDTSEMESKQIDVALGAEVRGLRNKRDMTQDDLAAESGIGKRTIIRLERGERPMTMSQLYKIARALGVKPSRLIDAAEAEIGID